MTLATLPHAEQVAATGKEALVLMDSLPTQLAHLPHDVQIAAILTASPEALKAAWQRHQSRKANAARWSGPRAPRCNCQAMTAARAAKRGHKC